MEGGDIGGKAMDLWSELVVAATLVLLALSSPLFPIGGGGA
jgi:hypothetical protein